MKKNFKILYFTLFSALMSTGCEHLKPLQVDEETDQLSLADFPSAETCAECHPNHYQEWRGSAHAYAAIDPVFLEMQKLGQEETGQKLGQFCIQCHSPVSSKLGLTPPGYKNEDLPAFALEGVNCIGCHAISKIKENKNAELEYDPRTAIRGPIADPVQNNFHRSVYDDNFKQSLICGACHNVVNGVGVTIEDTFGEWQRSPAREIGQKCTDCHMPAYRGKAAVNGPEREVHRHFFVGVDVALIDFPDRRRQSEMVTALLQSAAALEVEAPSQTKAGDYLPISVNVTSKTAGHHLPSGAVADRQMWLEVTLTDKGSGQIIYQSGHLDANGDLMDRHSELQPSADQDLIQWHQKMAGANGNDVFFSWQAFDQRTQTIPPLETVSLSYDQLLPAQLTGPLQLKVKLRFRTFPPFLLRKLNLDELAAQLPIVDMAQWEGTISTQ